MKLTFWPGEGDGAFARALVVADLSFDGFAGVISCVGEEVSLVAVNLHADSWHLGQLFCSVLARGQKRFVVLRPDALLQLGGDYGLAILS